MTSRQRAETAILACARKPEVRGGVPVGAGAHGPVAAVLDTTGLDRLIRMLATRREALAAFATP